MTIGDTLIDVWREVLVEGKPVVEIFGQSCRVGRTRSGLRTIGIPVGGMIIEGIEQNPEKTSRWAELARQGKKIMQFRAKGRYVGNVCDGALLRYPAWKSLGLAD